MKSTGMKMAQKKSFIKHKETGMTNLTFFEKRRVPIYDDPSQVEQGLVEFDYEKCSSCGMCVKICPSSTLDMIEKKVRMKQPPGVHDVLGLRSYLSRRRHNRHPELQIHRPV